MPELRMFGEQKAWTVGAGTNSMEVGNDALCITAMRVSNLSEGRSIAEERAYRELGCRSMNSSLGEMLRGTWI